ncbi:DUF3016 domain-containing protein [Ferrimonas senticii]|uniref:DUF3016 domain-containing protein n=1 Tax=Ferrimonas senticii TaxID=394566 RepID=UPI000A043582|nr:DUF3016 domain-containing protein [Ferrimonas senticii]
MRKLIWLMAAFTSVGVMAAEQSQSWPQQDGVVTVVWQQPNEYRDVKAASGIQSRYQNHVFATLGKHLQRQISPKLTDGQKLKIIVTDLDLAGDVRPTFGASASDIRVVKSVYPPRMSFSFQLLGADNQVRLQQQVELKDLGFDVGGVRRYSNEALHYEMQMLDDWVKQDLTQALARQ